MFDKEKWSFIKNVENSTRDFEYISKKPNRRGLYLVVQAGESGYKILKVVKPELLTEEEHNVLMIIA